MQAQTKTRPRGPSLAQGADVRALTADVRDLLEEIAHYRIVRSLVVPV